MQFINNNMAQTRKIFRRFGPTHHQRDLLGRGQQYFGRIGFLALLAVCGGVARSRLDADIKPHLFNWRH